MIEVKCEKRGGGKERKKGLGGLGFGLKGKGEEIKSKIGGDEGDGFKDSRGEERWVILNTLENPGMGRSP